MDIQVKSLKSGKGWKEMEKGLYIVALLFALEKGNRVDVKVKNCISV